ncbi:MAG: hypothetical protein JST47_11455 [Bacteroidetes bacterium]|nr:hypothetical protein [Bacteroidota bacterium]MBS1973081.1 hypothetical protein [Bacteroidota bacterium]
MKNEFIKSGTEAQLLLSGKDHDPSFSKHEKFGALYLSLDSIKRRLMVSKVVNKIRQSIQIPLNVTRLISIKKAYSNIYIGQLRYRKLEEFLETIYLQIEFFDGRNTIHLPVFDRASNNLRELPEIEKKVKYWQDLLSELRLVKDK